MKMFAQMKTMYLWYFIMLMQLPGMLAFEKSDTQMAVFSLAIMAMLMGIVVAGLLKDIGVCPVTFCLPSQAKIPMKVIIIWACVAPSLLLVIRLFTPSFSESPLYGAIAPFAAVEAFLFAIYFMSASLIYMNDFTGRIGYFGCSTGRSKFDFRNNNLANFAFPLIVFSVILGGSRISALMVKYPLQVSVLCSGIALYCGAKMHNSARRRELCGKEIVSNVQGWTPNKNAGMLLADFAEKNRGGDKIAFAERLFTKTINNARSTVNRLTLGYIYNMIDCIGIRFWQAIFTQILVLIIWGYCFSNIGGTNHALDPRNTVLCMIYIFPAFGALLWALPMHASLHVPAGRRDKFNATLISTVVLTALGTVIVFGVVVVDKLIAPWMPSTLPFLPYTNPDAAFSFATPSLEFLWITPAIMPIGFAFSALFGRGGLVRMMVVSFIVIAEEMIVIFLSYKSGGGLQMPLLVIAAGWLFYIWALRRLCFKLPIAGPGRD
jgi:hypothetical protein